MPKYKVTIEIILDSETDNNLEDESAAENLVYSYLEDGLYDLEHSHGAEMKDTIVTLPE
jgi:hypothetical protein